MSPFGLIGPEIDSTPRESEMIVFTQVTGNYSKRYLDGVLLVPATHRIVTRVAF